MAKGIVVSVEGEVSSFGLTRIDREKLYGRKAKVIVDEEGRTAIAALLTRDGSALVPPGGTAQLSIDDSFECFERSELRAVDANGNPVDPVPSTLGVEQKAQQVEPKDVLDHALTALYQLTPDALGDKLKAALEAGTIFKTRFNYRDDFDDAPAFLLKNDQGFFALIAQPTPFEFVHRDTAAAVPDAAPEEDADDLDFSMM